MSRLTCIALALAAATSFACSSNPGSPDGGRGMTGSAIDGGILLGQFESAYAAAFCQAGAACVPEAAYFKAGCASGVQNGGVLSWVQQVLADVDAGFVRYDPVAAAACVQAESQVVCDLRRGPPPAACAEAFVSQLPIGASCYDSFDCDAGYCSASLLTCPGTCTAYLARGANCSGGGQCDPSSNCVLQGSDAGGLLTSLCEPAGQVGEACDFWGRCVHPLACIGGTCAPLGAAGTPCEMVDSLGPCQAGLFCDASDGGTSTCTAQIGRGGACGQNVLDAIPAQAPAEQGGQCATGLVCAGFVLDAASSTTAPGSCQPPSDVNGSCTLGSEAGFPVVTGCLFGLACVGGRCQMPPTSGACAPDPSFPCDPDGYYCDPASKTCKAQSPAGAACNSSLGGEDCTTGNCDATGHCAVPAPSCLAP